jgi:hypothetical protein
VPQVFSTQAGESGHKENAKKPANNTQKREHSFLFQVGKKYCDNIKIERAFTESATLPDPKEKRSVKYHISMVFGFFQWF